MRKKDDYQNIKSFLAEGVEIKGKLHSNGSIRIDGTVDGELEVKGDLFVGSTGFVKGEVKVENATLAGKIEGNLTATGKLEINSTGQVLGDIKCAVFTIEEGGILEGKSSMVQRKEALHSSTERQEKQHKK